MAGGCTIIVRSCVRLSLIISVIIFRRNDWPEFAVRTQSVVDETPGLSLAAVAERIRAVNDSDETIWPTPAHLLIKDPTPTHRFNIPRTRNVLCLFYCWTSRLLRKRPNILYSSTTNFDYWTESIRLTVESPTKPPTSVGSRQYYPGYLIMKSQHVVVVTRSHDKLLTRVRKKNNSPGAISVAKRTLTIVFVQYILVYVKQN